MKSSVIIIGLIIVVIILALTCSGCAMPDAASQMIDASVLSDLGEDLR